MFVYSFKIFLSFPYFKDLTKEEAMLLLEMRKKSPDLRKVVKLVPKLDTAAIEYNSKLIQAEMKRYASRSDNRMMDTTASGLEKFSLQVWCL